MCSARWSHVPMCEGTVSMASAIPATCTIGADATTVSRSWPCRVRRKRQQGLTRKAPARSHTGRRGASHRRSARVIPVFGTWAWSRRRRGTPRSRPAATSFDAPSLASPRGSAERGRTPVKPRGRPGTGLETSHPAADCAGHPRLVTASPICHCPNRRRDAFGVWNSWVWNSWHERLSCAGGRAVDFRRDTRRERGGYMASLAVCVHPYRFLPHGGTICHR